MRNWGDIQSELYKLPEKTRKKIEKDASDVGFETLNEKTSFPNWNHLRAAESIYLRGYFAAAEDLKSLYKK